MSVDTISIFASVFQLIGCFVVSVNTCSIIAKYSNKFGLKRRLLLEVMVLLHINEKLI